MKQVYEFRDGGKEMMALLGGKGANLLIKLFSKISP